MPIQLLPASAQAFAPRSDCNVVLNQKVEPWLTQTLKRINRIKRPLNSVTQHHRCLTETLSGPDAIWTLCSIMLPKAPEADLRKDDNPLIEALFNYQLIHIDAYCVHVDMVSQHEVAFKLTQDTITALIEYHKDIWSVDASASLWNWSEKEVQLKKLQEEFVQAVNRFVFRTGVRALDGLEEEGSGELLDSRSEDVKSAIMGLFHPLLPPPPRIVDVINPAPLLPSSTSAGNWWQPTQQSLPGPQHPAPVESWRVLPSTPSPTTTSASTCTNDVPPTFWPGLVVSDAHLPSPAPSYSHPFTSAGQLYSSPEVVTAISSMPLPSPLTQQCGSSAAQTPGLGGFAWSYNDFNPQYATAV